MKFKVTWYEILITLPPLFVIASKILKRDNYNPEIAAAFISSFIHMKAFLKENPNYREVIINDDFMPNDLGLLAAFQWHGKKIYAFRVNDASSRVTSPVWLDKLYCMSSIQMLEFSRSKSKKLFEQLSVEVKVPDLRNRKLIKIGHPLTAKFNPEAIVRVFFLIGVRCH